ncbi:MAG: hypothetical protein ACREOS_03155 [Candidatus Dormibacteraceae bacterium]
MRRLAKGETTQRSDWDADQLIARLRARGVARLADQADAWAIVDPSELRKPDAPEMADLMEVRALRGEGTVPGYRTLNVLGVGTADGRGGRGAALQRAGARWHAPAGAGAGGDAGPQDRAAADQTSADDRADRRASPRRHLPPGSAPQRAGTAPDQAGRAGRGPLGERHRQTLLALGWVAAGFLDALGVSFDWPALRLLARLGGAELRLDRPPGTTLLARALQRLLDHLATPAILTDEIRTHGS